MIPILVSGILILLAFSFIVAFGTPKTRNVPYTLRDVEDQLVSVETRLHDLENKVIK